MGWWYSLAADLAVAVHFLWIVFVVTGALFLRHHRRLRWVHLTALVYSLGIEVYGWICPLTILEQWLRVRGAAPSYEGSFIPYYMQKLIYLPAPQGVLVAAAALVLLLSALIYFCPRRKGGLPPGSV